MKNGNEINLDAVFNTAATVIDTTHDVVGAVRAGVDRLDGSRRQSSNFIMPEYQQSPQQQQIQYQQPVQYGYGYDDVPRVQLQSGYYNPGSYGYQSSNFGYYDYPQQSQYQQTATTNYNSQGYYDPSYGMGGGGNY